MSDAAKNIIVRVVKNKLAAGKKFADIIKMYPKLTAEEIEELKNSL